MSSPHLDMLTSNFRNIQAPLLPFDLNIVSRKLVSMFLGNRFVIAGPSSPGKKA